MPEFRMRRILCGFHTAVKVDMDVHRIQLTT